jgi:hypothetical protein
MVTAVASASAAPGERESAQRVPWMVWTASIATVSTAVGGVWDISWHISVGRDTFWTPPHMLIQLCAVIGGVTAVYLIARTTFYSDDVARKASVSVFGLRAPLGAFMCGWGALAMLTSAPFDNWWHEAYGLDVKVLSPPHAVLAVGAIAVIYGGFVLIMAQLNRAGGELRGRLETIFLCLIGVIMMGAHADLIEFSNRVLMHSSVFYRAFAVPFPIELMVARSIARRRWASTTAAGVYTCLALLQEWILPLVPAEQKLGPVYQRVPHMVPLGFPILVIVAALLIDVLWTRMLAWNNWRKAAATGAMFLVALVATQWPFANFLASHWAANWFFGSHYQFYMVPPDTPFARGEFVGYETTVAEFWRGMAIALGTAMLTSRAGLAIGTWMRSVQR